MVHDKETTSLNCDTTIRQIWTRARLHMFNGVEKKIELKEVKKIASGMERNIYKIGAFGVQIEKKDDFNLLIKPLEEFQRNYVIFLGTLTAMGLGKLAGKTLKKSILTFGDNASNLWCQVEEIIKSQDLNEIKSLSIKIGQLVDIITKQWIKIPRQNNVAIKINLVEYLNQIKDCKRELDENCFDFGGFSDEDDDDIIEDSEEEEEKDILDHENSGLIENLKEFINMIDKSITYTIHNLTSDCIMTINEMESYHDIIKELASLIDEIAISLQLEDELDGDYLLKLDKIDIIINKINLIPILINGPKIDNEKYINILKQ